MKKKYGIVARWAASYKETMKLYEEMFQNPRVWTNEGIGLEGEE